MNNFEILKMPSFRFAHGYEADAYENNFTADKTKIEVTYIYEGEALFKNEHGFFSVKSGDILCQTYGTPSSVNAKSFHSHRTVCVDTLWDYADNSAGGLYLPPVTRYCSESEEIIRMINSFVFSPYIYEASSTRTASCFLNILCAIDSIYRKSNKSSVPEYSIIAEKAKKYIQKNITNPITQKEIADFLNVTPGYLCTVFKKSVGMPLIKYVNTIKLKSIHSLMEKEKLKLYEAAALYGYADANYVSSLYKKMFGHNITTAKNKAEFD